MIDKNVKKIDLHVHTSASDGSKSPIEIMKYCNSKQIAAISITDHDTLEGIKMVIHEKDKYGIEVIPGVEISAQGDQEVHILGYFINVYSEKMNMVFNELRNARQKESLWLLRKLKENKIDIRLQELICKGYSVDGYGITQLMIEKGYVETKEEAREKYFKEGKVLHILKKRMSIQDAIWLIKDAGGIASLAHPITIATDKDDILRQIKVMKDFGLDGIECFNSKMTAQNEKEYFEIAKQYELVVTGGSDYHGLVKPNVEVGEVRKGKFINYEILESMKIYYMRKVKG